VRLLPFDHNRQHKLVRAEASELPDLGGLPIYHVVFFIGGGVTVESCTANEASSTGMGAPPGIKRPEKLL
jgi:hypothetical protein